MKFSSAFTPEKLSEAWQVITTTFAGSLWETVYATLLSTLFAIIIGLPLGKLLHAYIMMQIKVDSMTFDVRIAAASYAIAFALTVLRPVLRTLYATPGTEGAAYRFMCMLIVACLMTAMMENEPLNAMRPCNVAMFYALACAVHADRRKAE